MERRGRSVTVAVNRFGKGIVLAAALLACAPAAAEPPAAFHERAVEVARSTAERARTEATRAIAAVGAAARDPATGPPMIAGIALLTGLALGVGLTRRRQPEQPAPAEPAGAAIVTDDPPLPAPLPAPVPLPAPLPVDADPAASAPSGLPEPLAGWSPERVTLVAEIVRILAEEAAAEASVPATDDDAAEPAEPEAAEREAAEVVAG
jgi:hypothetical protein